MSERVQTMGDGAKIRVVENPQMIDNPVIDFFLDYWRSARGTDSIPHYSRFVPKEVGGKLPWVVVADALPEFEDFRYRVIGSRVCEYFLGNSTGKTVTEAFSALDPLVGASVLSIFRRACVKRVPMRITGPSMMMAGAYCPDYDTIYLPYSSDGITADRVINAMVFNISDLVRRSFS